MKLEDCKPGTRVRVYSYDKKVYCGFIDSALSDLVFVARDNETKLQAYYPQQLRKIVKKKKPEIMCVFSKTGKWQGVFFDETPELIKARKQNGREVWIMRGVKKL